MLRRVLLVTAALFLSASAPCAAEVQTTLAGRIIRVSDGDTVTLLTADKKSIRIRLAGIDAPESKQAWGTRARQAMMSCAYGKTAVVLSHKTDRYGRRVGLLTVNGVDCGLQLLHSGLAWLYVANELELPYKVRNV